MKLSSEILEDVIVYIGKILKKKCDFYQKSLNITITMGQEVLEKILIHEVSMPNL